MGMRHHYKRDRALGELWELKMQSNPVELRFRNGRSIEGVFVDVLNDNGVFVQYYVKTDDKRETGDEEPTYLIETIPAHNLKFIQFKNNGKKINMNAFQSWGQRYSQPK